MKRAFVGLCLGLSWAVTAGCSSEHRDIVLTPASGTVSAQPVGSGADAAAGTASPNASASASGEGNVPAPGSGNPGGQPGGDSGVSRDGGSEGAGAAKDAQAGSNLDAGGTAGSSDAGGGQGPNGSDAASGNGAGADGGSGGSQQDAIAAATEFCDAYFEGICTWRVACGRDCISPGGYLNYAIECNDAIASLRHGTLTYDAAAAAECIAGFDVSGCPAGGGGAQPEACSAVFVGAVALGGECAATEFAQVFDECATGFCKRELQSGAQRYECLGTCEPFAALGETCDESSMVDIRCAPGLVCANDRCEEPGGVDVNCESVPCQMGLVCAKVPPITCREPAPLNAACRDSEDCGFPGVCVDSKCVVGVAEGEYCRGDDSCAGGFCDGTVCGPVVAPGDSCDNGERCEPGYACSLDEPYICVKASGAENESCGPWRTCDFGLWCTAWTAGSCVKKGNDGYVCPSNDACNTGLWCMADGQCHAPGEQDGPCIPDAPYATCVAGFFCDPATALCDAPRDEGEPCNSMTSTPGQACAAGLYCQCVGDDCPSPTAPHPEDVCVPQKADGAPCQSTSECLSGACLLGATCGAPPLAIPNCTR